MCLVKEHRFPKRAREDIIVYKVMEKDTGGLEINDSGEVVNETSYHSPWYSSRDSYYLGDTIKSKISPLWGIIGDRITCEGVHCFSSFSTASLFAKGEATIHSIHSVVRARIPKGAFFYLGGYQSIDQVAAERLELLEEIVSYPTDEDIENAQKEKDLEQRRRLKGYGKKKKKH